MVSRDEIHDFAQVVSYGGGECMRAHEGVFTCLRGGERLANIRAKSFRIDA